ncbi:serine carboxypeptidase [Durotheca rogersii]|uniref:serine carboxypeptidase n=1 Tax=Durotheca rogersii TaxID=419775 RepID=UPI002220D823|nr:serine carboxypeptidase [Durotheca rogersii]KAI5864095.1 serine carboxypeptidase [Durotheca rogersii]
MLFLDQPTQVGFSYDTLQNVTRNLFTGQVTVLEPSDPIPEQSVALLVGTFPSQIQQQTARGSRNAAIALWHFAQAWFQEFPGYHPADSRVSISTESYGGRYGPAIAAFFQEQNQRIANGTWNDSDGDNYVINLDTLILINSCIDRQIQWPSYPHIAFNNTYGIQAVNESVYLQMVDALERPGGCRDQIDECRALARARDPENRGVSSEVNEACSAAETFCSNEVRGPYLDYSGRSYYDLASVDPNPFPAPFYQKYLNQPHVQRALGVPVNFTQSSRTVSAAFRGIGDYPRPGWVEDLAELLDGGVKVHLAYGDRDYACNWIGGEAVSLAVNYSGAAAFRAAGYTDIVINETYVGGQVRQHGNLSFARVYQAGHEIPSYQPETAYRMFLRALGNRDIATGEVDLVGAADEYSTVGPADTWAIRNEDLPDVPHFCYVYDASTCTDSQIEAVVNGSAVIVDGIVRDEISERLFPEIFGGGSEGGEGGGGGEEGATNTPGSAATRFDARSVAVWAAVIAIMHLVL